MLLIIRKLILGVSLIVAAAGVLLMSDLKRRTVRSEDLPSIAVFQFASTTLQDEGMRGIMDALAEAGLADGVTARIQQYNAQNDLPTANAIAAEITDGRYKIVLTVSTMCLQVTANANRAGKAIQVFGLVTDPFGSGVGISRENPLDHPRHLVGIGSFQPVEKSFAIARQLCPNLKRVGVVWNPGEACSQACTLKARAKCKELGIELIEATVEASAGVLEAAKSVIERGAEAIWVGGDNTVTVAVEGLIATANGVHIPVFTNEPNNIKQGALFALGANYHEVGRKTGEMAVSVLRGADTTKTVIKNVLPERFSLNATVLKSLQGQWRVPPDLLAQAELLIDEKGFQNRAPERKPSPGRAHGGSFRIAMVQIVDNPVIDKSCRGVLDGLAESGFAEGREYSLARFNANGEPAQLPLIMSSIKSQGADLVVTSGTPVMIAAAKAIKDIPIVFTVGSDPKVVGVFSHDDQRPANLVGVHDDPPVDRLIDLAGQRGAVDCVGTVWDPSQPNSEISVRKLRATCGQRKIRLVESTAATIIDLTAATESLCQRGAAIIIVSADNLTTTGFPAIVAAARKSNVPVYATEPSLVQAGAAGAIGDDYYEWGKQSGRLAAKVLGGARPGDLPIEKTRVQRTVLPGGALPSPDDGESKPLGKQWSIAVLCYSDSPLTEDTLRGIHDGLRHAGLIEGRDIAIKVSNAQGDMATLNSIAAAAKTAGADLVMTISTPTLQTAIKQFGNIPVVFTTVASGVLAGAGKSESDHLPNITGVTTFSAFEEMGDLLRQCLPQARRVVTLFTPGEVNSVLHRDKLEEALKRRGVELISVPVNTASEVADAALAACNKDVDAICQISDNLTSTAFASISRQAEKAKLPIFSFVAAQPKQGALLAIARDYHDAGFEAAQVAARIMRGASPASIPFTNVKRTRLVINATRAQQLGLSLPQAVAARADEVIK